MHTLDKPTLLLNTKKCRANIEKMVQKAQRNNIAFRPHFKTHQSREIGNWFRAYGIDRITVSSPTMANYFAADGWNDITVAFPVNIREIATINALASTIQLNLLVESVETVEQLAQKLKAPVRVFIKADTVYDQLVEHSAEGWGELIPDAYLKKLSQEHGIVQAPVAFIEKIQLGDIVKILPVHSCTTANLYNQYVTTEGEKISRL